MHARKVSFYFVAVALVLALFACPGCVSSAAKKQASDTAAAHDQYAALTEATLNGTIQPKDGKPVTAADLAATPASVRELLTNVIRALYLSRLAWHQLAFALEVGPDPKTLKTDPPALPK
jgi:hypothetical protein